MRVTFDASRWCVPFAVGFAILVTSPFAAVAGNTPPVCRGTPDPDAPLEIECTAEDDVGFSGVQLSPGSVNLSLGGAGFQATLPIVVRPTDLDLAASGGVLFIENAAVPESCEVNTLFLKDHTTLCVDSGITVSLTDSEYMKGFCDITGAPCNDENDCGLPMPQVCLGVCHGGVIDDFACFDDNDCIDGRCVGRTAECSLNLPGPEEPQMPLGYVQSPFCRIMTVRVRQQGSDTTVDLVKQGGFDPTLRLMFAESSAGIFPPFFKDVTVEVEQVCGTGVGGSGFLGEDPTEFGTRDKGCGDLGGGISPPGPATTFPPQVKLTCANFVGYSQVDCQNAANQNRDDDSDCFPVCAGDVLLGCGGVNPGNLGDCNDSNADINPNATEACNGVDDDCNSICIGGDNAGNPCVSDDPCLPGGGFCTLAIDEGFNIDGDFLADCFDCQVPDSGTWKEPSAEVAGLRLEHSGGTTFIDWDPLAPACAGGETYDTISSVSPEFTTQSCVRNFGTGAFCSNDPASGQVFYFVVRAGNSCGDGPVGTGSDGTPRPAPPGGSCFLGGPSCP